MGGYSEAVPRYTGIGVDVNGGGKPAALSNSGIAAPDFSISNIVGGNGRVHDESDRSRFPLFRTIYKLLGYEHILVPASALVSYDIGMDAVMKRFACPFLSAVIMNYNPEEEIVTLSGLSTGANPKLWLEGVRNIKPAELLEMAGNWLYIPREESVRHLKSKNVNGKWVCNRRNKS